MTATPRTLEAALQALAAQPALLPIAGCTDVMVAAPERLPGGGGGVLDLLSIPELRGIRAEPWGLDIGAAVTFSELRRSPVVARALPVVAEAAAVVGGWQIQNRATIGGNVANASPAGDSLPALLAVGARLVVASAAGAREIPYDEFHTGYRKTALRPGELVTRIQVPFPQAGVVQRFRKVGPREAQAISKVVVAMAARMDGGTIAEIRIAAGSVAATPVRLREAEAAAVGRRPLDDTAARVGRAAASGVTPIDDVRSTAAYRAFALERVVRRMILSL